MIIHTAALGFGLAYLIIHTAASSISHPSLLDKPHTHKATSSRVFSEPGLLDKTPTYAHATPSLARDDSSSTGNARDSVHWQHGSASVAKKSSRKLKDYLRA
ncbi:hypothetical protein PMIN02_009883 [Paraphaeosphaeria minitans]